MPLPEDMQIFVSVVERGSFAQAARIFDLTPSAVSKIVSRLERRLGVQLLTRTTRRLALTSEGVTYLSRCREILAAIEAAESELRLSKGRPRGRICVSAGTAVGRHQLVHLVPEFLEQYPDITVDLRITDRRVDLVAESVDVAVRVGALTDSSLLARKVAVARRLVCASPAYLAKRGTPKRPADLLKHNCITIEGFPHLRRWPFRTPDGIQRVEVSGNLTTDSADAMLDLAIAGHGVVRMVDIHLNDVIDRGRLLPLLGKQHVDEPTPISLVSPPQRNQVPRVRALLDFLTDRLGRGPSGKNR
jgi:DNA-binding transcriptional LysR family regulator